MRQKDLEKFSTLKATPKIMKLAAEDKPSAPPYSWMGKGFARELYMRCALAEGILRVAFYLPTNLRTGGKLPTYELFIDKGIASFLTHNLVVGKWLEAKLDRLYDPSMVHFEYDMDKVWVSPTDNKKICAYLGSAEEKAYRAILQYQRKVRKDALEARYRKITDKWDADLNQVPGLPNDWLYFVSKKAVKDNYIYYEYSRNIKTGYCTYCEKDVPLSIGNPHHNREGHCPRCHHKVTYKCTGRVGRIRTQEYDVSLIQNCRDGFVLRVFTAYRTHTKENYKTPVCQYHEERRTIIPADGSAPRAYNWASFKQRELRWCLGRVYNTYWNYHPWMGAVYKRNFRSLVKKGLNRTGLVDWIRSQGRGNPEHFIAVQRAVPQLEQLVKAHLPRLTYECVFDCNSVKPLIMDANAKSLTKALGLDTQGLKRLRQANGGAKFLSWLQYEKVSGKRIPDNVLLWFQKEGIEQIKLRFIWEKMNAVQVYNYVRRQMAENHATSEEVLTTWKDYLSMAAKYDMDVDDEIIYRVHKLYQRHSELVARGYAGDAKEQATKVLKEYPELNNIIEPLQKKYEYNGKEFAVVAPRSVDDIILDGKVLQHCSATSERYWERMENKESYILFLRSAEAPDAPYYTLEVEPNGTVRQKRTKYDRQNADIERAKEFLIEWQQVISERLTEEDRVAADKSILLRLANFEQLKSKPLTISNGDLAGRLLLDVLEEDLMEVA